MEENLEYFEDEVRDGFYIPAMMKKCWKAQLIVLEDVVNVCKKHNIKYFAAWGTLLGAVRHKGYIPWDDDLDICMMRKDYEKFCKVALKDMPENYSVKNFQTDDTHYLFLARVLSSKKFRFDEEYLKKYCGLPYIFGIDIFIVDYLDKDEEKESEKQKKVKNLISIADGFHLGNVNINDSIKIVETLEKIYNIKIDKNRKIAPQVYALAEKLLGETTDSQADKIRQQVPALLNDNKEYFYPKSYLEEAKEVDFEDGKMVIPKHYADVLRKKYGSFMTPVKDASGHNYPFYKKQHREIEETLKCEVPSFLVPVYKCPKEEEIVGSSEYKIQKCEEITYKAAIKEWLNNLEIYTEKATNETISEIKKDMSIFETCQSFAINIGQTIDEMKGENHETVSLLEEYCEKVFIRFSFVNEEKIKESEEAGKDLWTSFKKAKASVEEKILNKKEIVFFPFKEDYWDCFELKYDEAIKTGADVFVVPIPYYYKTFDGNLIKPHFVPLKYPEELKVKSFETFDIMKHFPDEIYIQSPYDAYNASTSVHPDFYSSQLKDCCEKLVYIPYFKTEEFKKFDGRDYKNMEYYCNQPGLVNADLVIVQSENIKERYVEKLTEFAGEKTKEIWERKIIVNNNLPDNKKGTKKTIIYYLNTNLLFADSERFLIKVKETLEIFSNKKEEIDVIIVVDDILEQTMKLEFNDKYVKFRELIKEAESEGFLKEVTKAEVQTMLDSVDGFYGDDAIIVRKCRDINIPVMIESMY